MKIYTRIGDHGESQLFGGDRVTKDDPRLEALGTVDELNAQLGVCRALKLSLEIDAIVGRLQHEMFSLGAELSSPEPAAAGVALLTDRDVERLEQDIDSFDARLPTLREFILPGGAPTAAALHAARCLCRRAERVVVALAAQATVRAIVFKYLNRVSDLLFVLARSANAADGAADIPWQKLPV